VWGFLFAEDAPYRRAAAEALVSGKNPFELFISPVVLYEIGECLGEFGAVLKNKIDEVAPNNLSADDGILGLAGEYIARGIIPGKFSADASHIAYASFYGLDYLASYNFKHIVKVKTKTMVALVNNLLGYTTPAIISPEELVDYDW